MPSQFAPVAFFAFNRALHAQRTLAALALNAPASQSALHVFIDGPRNAAERVLVDEVIGVATSAAGFASVQVHVAESNQGLYASITSGVSTVLRSWDRVIVVEDDILVSPDFLAYMNDALGRFKDDSRVACIHGFSPPLRDLPDYFFLPGGDCWGWATWADRWCLFNDDARSLLRTIDSRGGLRAFAASHGYESLRQLAQRVRGKNQSWAILWHASLFLAGRLTLHPGKTFVQNIGNDGSGVHSGVSDAYTSAFRGSYSGIPDLAVTADESSARAVSDFMDGVAGQGLFSRLKRVVLSAHTHLLVRRTLGSRP